MCETSKALLCTEHPPARVRQIFGFAKVSGRLNIKASDGLHALFPFKKKDNLIPNLKITYKQAARRSDS